MLKITANKMQNQKYNYVLGRTRNMVHIVNPADINTIDIAGVENRRSMCYRAIEMLN
jgi:hypothetical protein